MPTPSSDEIAANWQAMTEAYVRCAQADGNLGDATRACYIGAVKRLHGWLIKMTTEEHEDMPKWAKAWKRLPTSFDGAWYDPIKLRILVPYTHQISEDEKRQKKQLSNFVSFLKKFETYFSELNGGNLKTATAAQFEALKPEPVAAAAPKGNGKKRSRSPSPAGPVEGGDASSDDEAAPRGDPPEEAEEGPVVSDGDEAAEADAHLEETLAAREERDAPKKASRKRKAPAAPKAKKAKKGKAGASASAAAEESEEPKEELAPEVPEDEIDDA